MIEAFQYDVFISHSSMDKAVARELANRLRADGLRVWFDEWEINPGDMIGLKIERGLEFSRTLVLVMSGNAFASDWVTLERHTALFRDPTNAQRRLVPLRLDDAEINNTLKQLAYVDWRKRSDDQYALLLTACRPSKILAGHAEYVGAVAVTADGKRIISGSGDNTVRVWNVVTGECLAILEGHDEPVNGVAVTSDGWRAISGSDDKTVRVWDVQLSQCLTILEGHTGPVNGVELSVDGQRAVSCSKDGTVRVWDVETAKCVRVLEAYRSSKWCSADARWTSRPVLLEGHNSASVGHRYR
jgi:WD40 repeat protein